MSDVKRPLLQRLQEDAGSVITELIYEKVNNLLGSGNQLFTMEFPARPLNGAAYTYDADDIYSVLTKPIAVQEAEFTLSDALYDTVPIVQASNGEKLSVVYKNLLNNYVPKLDFLHDFVTDKNELRQWLLTEVEDYDEAAKETIKISRMGLCKKLYGEFLKQRNQWAMEKSERFNSSKSDMEAYAQWVTSEGLVRDEQLNNLFNDAVVRGNYHEVMTILGFLNIESPAEMLERTKQNMRGSSRRSLDASKDVYPVQFQPTNWFKALKPNLNPKDLTMSSEALVAEYRAKERRLRALEQRLCELSETDVSEERIAELKQAVRDKKLALAEADRAVMAAAGDGGVQALHMAIRIYRNLANPAEQFGTAIESIKTARQDNTVPAGLDKNLYDLLENVATEALDGMKKNYDAVAGALAAMEGAVAAEAEYAAAMTQNFAATKSAVITQINNLKAELEHLKPLVTNTLAEAAVAKPQTEEEKQAEATRPLLPEDAKEDVSDSTFMDVILKSEMISTKSKESSEQAAANSSWKVGGWFYSAARASSSASASHSKDVKDDSLNIEIGFRVTKVSIERGGWFEPGLFKMTGNFSHLAEMRSAGGINKDQIREAMLKTNTDRELKNLVTYVSQPLNKNTGYLLPSFPTAFVIAKDITIRVKVSSEEAASNKEYATAQSQSSGGFFGFSASSGSSSTHASESAYVGMRNDFIYIRIPGPQILGWFQQLVPADQSTPYQPMGDMPFKNVLQLLNQPAGVGNAE